MEKKRKIVFFDFDGVIADSFSIAFEINKIIDPNIVSENDYRKLFDRNIAEWAVNSNPKEELDKISREFFKKYIPQMKNVKIFPAMKKVIAKLGKIYTLFIISSTITSPIRDFLERNNILSYFNDILGSKFIDTNKTERIKTVFKNYGVGAKDCVFITDTLGDIREAASVGVQSIGVTWGFQKKENLIKGNPLRIAEKPEELFDIVSNYFKQK